MKPIYLLPLFLSFSVNAHQHAHVHGAAELKLVVDGNQLLLELEASAADIVGFEHLPESEAQLAQTRKAKIRLQQFERLFKLDRKCQLETTEIESQLLDYRPLTHSHDGLGEHSHHNENHHQNDGKAHQHDKKHSDGHADIRVNYQLNCKQPPQQMTLQLFKYFPDLTEIKAVTLSNGTVSVNQLTSKQATVAW